MRTSELAAANLRLQQEVAAHEHAIENLIAATDQLTASNRELEVFASAASHDLQEPLRKIRTFADRLLNRHTEGVSEAARDDLVRISSAAQRMSALIEDLLAYARLSRQAAAATPVDLGEVARGVLTDLALQIEGSAARVEIGPLPAVEADEAQMRQLLQNLVSNALKFVAPGTTPVVRVHAEVDRAATPPICRLFVADSGIGLDPRYGNRIFDMFQRLNERGRYPGSGIGLAICHRIVERHGGSIHVASRVGHGSTFVVTLPLAQTSPARGRGVRGEAMAKGKTDGGQGPGLLERAAQWVSVWSGSDYAFALAAATVGVWLLTGPLFDYSDTWQLVINTGTTIVTFLMVFLIQRSQNKEGRALQVKLDELISAVATASNRLIGAEELSERELEALARHYRHLTSRLEPGPVETPETTIDRK